jgi:hypothetical protein
MLRLLAEKEAVDVASPSLNVSDDASEFLDATYSIK